MKVSTFLFVLALVCITIVEVFPTVPVDGYFKVFNLFFKSWEILLTAGLLSLSINK